MSSSKPTASGCRSSKVEDPQLVQLLDPMQPSSVLGVDLDYLLLIGRTAADNANRLYC